ncbi:hypothetical protein [Paenibacillus sonchi]|uniref:hypothetical protein n=1 Tax=Paenibacillus sonchi TaxID=373687 RepID=UPI001E49BB28|nr:hypothetical protein [Paenibacillus sonchi]MCE3202455.1 hypothetical protein [Paenibacillus sonchi]
MEAAKNEIGKPFEFEASLQHLVARQSEINSALEFKELQQEQLLMKEESHAPERAWDHDHLQEIEC